MNKQLNRIWRQMTADKKRFGIMLSLVCVGLLLWGRLILLEKVPRVATADPDETEQVETEAPRAVPQRPTVAVDLPETLSLDLFAFRPDRYNPILDPESGEEGLQTVDPGADEWEQREALMDEARGMALQGVFRGSQPFAVIDGVRVYIGDTVGGFELIELSDRERYAKLRSESFVDLVVILRMSDG